MEILNGYFEKANEQLRIKNVSGFSEAIHQLFENLTCNCYLNGKGNDIYQNQLEIINEFEEDDFNYDFNLAIGYLYARTNEKEKAYQYLSKAISINLNSDLAFALRACIGSEINPYYIEDAKNAVLLNPNARNYFILANVVEYNKDPFSHEDSPSIQAITCYNKSIERNPNFVCAYNNRAKCYKELNNLPKAIDDLKKCIELDPNHWAYYKLSIWLSNLKKYREAIKYAELGFERHPDNAEYHYRLGSYYIMIDEFKRALWHFKKYLSIHPDYEFVNTLIKKCNDNILNKKLDKARTFFSEECFKDCVQIYEDCEIDRIENIPEDDICRYLIASIKQFDETISINEDNLNYKRIIGLRNSYFEKIEKCEEVNNEEENSNKLMQYGENYHIGFGNYQHQKICDIAKEDPHYILWCIVNLEHFFVENKCLIKYHFKNDPLYIHAIEVNLIKELVLLNTEEEEDEYFEHSYYDYTDNYDSYEDSSYCPACQESPCMCSDPGW